MPETTTSSSGFWGDDGFTLDDASSIFDSIGTGLGWFGIGSTPDAAPASVSAGPAGTYTTPSNNTWIWYVVGGIVVLAVAIYFIRKRK